MYYIFVSQILCCSVKDYFIPLDEQYFEEENVKNNSQRLQGVGSLH